MISEWQPIETAPKDGTPVLLFVVMPDDDPYVTAISAGVGWERVNVGYWANGEWWHEHAGWPTHWMPLPEPPK